MSAVPHLGRLQLRRTAFERLARIRKERVVKIEFRLPYVAGLLPARVERVEPKKAERYEHETPEFHRYANWLHRLGGDPEDILRGVVQKILKKQKKVGPRLEPLLQAERERRRKREELGLPVRERRIRAARHPDNATHRKNLDRVLRLLLPDAKIRKQVVESVLDRRD